MVNSTWIGSPNHYAGRNGYEVTHITLHIMVGRLAGTDATFQNPVRQASKGSRNAWVRDPIPRQLTKIKFSDSRAAKAIPAS